MFQLGTYNTLTTSRETPQGFYLKDDEDHEVLLPRKYCDGLEVGREITVFLYKDSEDRLVATTRKPLITLHQFAALTVRDAKPMGAFLAWGLEKDLFVPAAEQKTKMKVGHTYLVYLYIDEYSERLAATSRLDLVTDNKELTVKEKDEVDLIIWFETDLGRNVIVNEKHKGLIYHDEIFQDLAEGDRMKGYVKKVRDDNNLDITLEPEGYKKVEPNAQKILDELKKAGGFLPYHDKTDPEAIRQGLAMSKKTFKQAIGGLYKERLIKIEKEGIRLNSKS